MTVNKLVELLRAVGGDVEVVIPSRDGDWTPTEVVIISEDKVKLR